MEFPRRWDPTPVAGVMDLSRFGLLGKILGSSANVYLSEETRGFVGRLWQGLRPWSEFVDVRKFCMPRSASDARHRLLINVGYFGNNYAVLCAVLCVVAILAHPVSIIAVVMVTVGAGYVVSHGARKEDSGLGNDGEDRLRIGPFQLGKTARLYAFVSLACLVLYVTGTMQFLGSWILVAMFFALAHAVSRESIDEPDFGEL